MHIPRILDDTDAGHMGGIMYFSEFHNHKWAKNLGHARALLAQGAFENFYAGEDLSGGDVYPGMRVMAAYWVSVEHEMRMRLRMLLAGAKHPEWREDVELLAQRDDFVARYAADMRELVERESIVAPERMEALVVGDIETPDGWAETMRGWQAATQTALEVGAALETDLVETWFHSCLRSVLNYNRYLIWGGVIAAALVRREGTQALTAAVDATAEAFMWEISREFYANVLPAAGFEDIGDIMELGMRGMFSDQYYVSGAEESLQGGTLKRSILKNCELGGVFQRVAEWNGLPKTALGYAICRYCETHGAATMMLTMPPMFHPEYRRIQSIGMDDKECLFELTLLEADDMERLMEAQERVFGEV